MSDDEVPLRTKIEFIALIQRRDPDEVFADIMQAAAGQQRRPRLLIHRIAEAKKVRPVKPKKTPPTDPRQVGLFGERER